jgi:hypothetical protein
MDEELRRKKRYWKFRANFQCFISQKQKSFTRIYFLFNFIHGHQLPMHFEDILYNLQTFFDHLL